MQKNEVEMMTDSMRCFSRAGPSGLEPCEVIYVPLT